MSASYYRFLVPLAATLSFALGACSSDKPQATAQMNQLAANEPKGFDSDATIWSFLGLTREHPEEEPGPKTGPSVNPILWEATRQTLGFAKTASADPMTGQLATKWYSPQGKTNERFKIYVFFFNRDLRSDSIAVNVLRQQLSPEGTWVLASVNKDLSSALQLAILRRAKELRRKWYPQQQPQ
jgi:hypothetical protein